MTPFEEIKTLFDIKEDNGFGTKEIALHQAVCEHIPQVLYDYYAWLGKIHPLNHTQDHLLTPDKLKMSKNKDHLIFYVENQYACVWGIRKEDLTANNPPVYMSFDENHWQKETQNLMDFLSAMAHLQAVFALEFNAEDFLWFHHSEQDLMALRSHFKKKPFYFSKWCVGIEFYGNDDTEVIAVFNEEYFTYACQNQERLLEIEEFLNAIGKP